MGCSGDEALPLDPNGYAHKGDHDRYFDQRTNDSRKRRTWN
jgi:hypothetical protein